MLLIALLSKGAIKYNARYAFINHKPVSVKGNIMFLSANNREHSEVKYAKPLQNTDQKKQGETNPIKLFQEGRI